MSRPDSETVPRQAPAHPNKTSQEGWSGGWVASSKKTIAADFPENGTFKTLGLSSMWHLFSATLVPLLSSSCFPENTWSQFTFLCDERKSLLCGIDQRQSCPETGEAVRLPVQLAGRWGQMKWNRVRWGKIYIFCTGPTRAAKAEQKSLVPTGPAERINQERAPFICTLSVPFSLSFNSQQGPPLSSLSGSNPIYEGKAKPPVSSLPSPPLWLHLSPSFLLLTNLLSTAQWPPIRCVYRELNADLDSRVGVSTIVCVPDLLGCHHF